MPPELLSMLTAMVTATVTLVAVHVANRANTNRLLLQLTHESQTACTAQHQEKLEELYVLTSRYTTLLASYYLPYLAVMKGELDYNQALDRTIEDTGRERPDAARLHMIVDLYFPGLQPQLGKLLGTRDLANSILAEHKARYKSGDSDGTEFVSPLAAALQRLNRDQEELMAAIVDQSEPVAADPKA